MHDNRDQGIVSSVIIFLIVVMLVFAITGCSTAVPVTAKFPERPGTLVSTPCPDLKKLPDQVVLSDVSRTVAENYTQYYECAVKLDAWIRWYDVQKPIFEGVK